MKDKKATILILAILLSLSTPSAISENDRFSVDYIFESVLDSQDGQWMIQDAQTLEVPGEPLIPYKTARILLPQDTEFKNIKVRYDEPTVQTGIDLLWGQPPCTFSDTPVKVGRNEETYNSNNWYPGKLYEVTGMSSFRGFQILNVILYPVQYQPRSQTVNFYETMTVEIQCNKASKNMMYRGLPADKAAAIDIVDNPDMVGTYSDGPHPLATEEYIIVTSSTLQSTFQDLANWKAGFVNGASVYDTSWIYSNYTGADSQEKIRDFIIDKYTNNGTKYVLLGGDTGVVPYRGFYVSSGGYTDSDMAADMYYAHLDDTFDNDGDGRYAESGEVDWYAEVAVGRAPVDNTTEAQAFVNKVIAYEQMNKPEAVMLHQSRVQSGNSPDARCLAWNCDDWVPGGYSITYVFEEDGDISKTDWRNAWASDHIANAHIGHGNTSIYYINYEPTVSWYNSDVSSLTNTFFPWTTSVACISGQFEASDCLSEQYVKDDCGAIGAIYNDNYGWFSTLNACQYSGEYCEMEFRACFSDGKENLGDFLNQARSYMVSSAQSNSTYRWCFYERNLMGDPETPCLTKRGEPGDTVDITYPSDGSEVCGTVNIAVSDTGCIDTVEFYLDGVLEHTDATAPFGYVWDTTQYPNGGHTILVEGYCSGVFTDDDSVNVTVNNEEYIIITNSTLQSAFQRLANWKACFVSGTGVYTVSWIYSNYTGVDNQEKIRNFIIDKHINKCTKYVLLGGDVSVVPYRGFYVSAGGYTESDMPADMYYGYLNGNWNNDGDGRYGEPGEEDWYPEVAVGRAPVNTVLEAEAFVDKVIAYEQMDKPKKVVLHRAGPGYCDLPGMCDDWVPEDYEIIYLVGPSPNEWLSAWASNPLIFQHMGSGTTDCVEISPGVYWCIEDVSDLTNTFWPIFMSPASFVGDFTANDCLAEVLVMDADNGAIAAIANASYSWFSALDECMYSPEFIEAMFIALFNDGEEHLGDMLNRGKNYMVSSAQSDSTYRWCFYAFNLIGDPETPALTKRNPPEVTITNPTDGSCVCSGGIVTITTSTTECIDEVKFYLIYVVDDEVTGELLCTDDDPPFQCSWDTTGYPEWKWYTIRADGYCPGTVMDVDEITVQLRPSCGQYSSHIVNYAGGEGVGTTLLLLLILFGSVGTIIRRR